VLIATSVTALLTWAAAMCHARCVGCLHQALLAVAHARAAHVLALALAELPPQLGQLDHMALLAQACVAGMLAHRLSDDR
jgi:hypothetical protein